MKWTVTTPAATTPISYALAHSHLRLLDDDERSYVVDCIEDATEFAETDMQCSLASRTITATYYDGETSGSTLYLPRGPVVSVSSVTAGGVAVSSANYELRRSGNTDYLHLSKPLSAPAVVVYVAGFSTLPNDIRRALLLHVADLYENREASAERQRYEVPNGLCRVYEKYRRIPLVD